MRTALVLLILTVGAFGADLPRYTVYRTSSPIVIDAKLEDAAWRKAPEVGDFKPLAGPDDGLEQTAVRLLWDDENLYVVYLCQDRHISASVAERHGPVSRDDCVELFISPNPEKVRNYYTFEINAIGTMLNQCRTDWRGNDLRWDPEGVRCRTTYQGQPRKDEDPTDESWIVELAVPFRNFVRDAARVPPQEGDLWRINLNRTGGISKKQASTWSPNSTGVRSFHVPQSFGWVRFAGRRP